MWQSLRQYIEPYLQDLPALMPYILVGIGLLLLLILARVLVLLWARKQVSDPKGAADEQEDEGGGGASSQRDLSGLQTAFSEAMRRLRRLMKRRGRHVNWFVRLTGHRYRYEVPWYALVGEEQSGKTTLLQSLDFEKPVEPVVTQNGTGTGGGSCNWWFFNQALFLDVAGQFVHRPSGGQASDEGWQQTLKQLRAYRPRQPLNGVVLTINCTDLIGDEQLEPAEIEDKAARMHTKLQQMQQQLGLRLPIYVVLTKSDAIPGFDAFCEELSPDQKREMMGWSNPHAVDAAYTSDWVDECFATLEQDLHYAQIQALGDNFKSSGQTVYETADTETFFLFPNQVQRLKENLRLYLDELFQQSAYQGAHFFRGVYFTGDEGASATGAMPEGTVAQGASSGEEEREPVFLEEFFREKVFKEWKLVRPLESAVSWQQWATQAMQWTVATLVFLGIFGLWYTGDELQERRNSILPSLRDAEESIQEVEKWRSQAASDAVNGSAQRDVGGELAFESVNSSLIRNMRQTSQVDLTFFLLPASWFSDLEETLDQSISSRYGKVILRSMRYGLRLRGERLSQSGLRSPRLSSTGTDSLSVQALPSYRAWRSYTEAIRAFETNAQRYNRLPRTRNLGDFASIAEYLFNQSISEDLQTNEAAYQRAIEQADPESLPLGQYRDPVSQRVLQYGQRFNDRLPRNFGLFTYLRDLAQELNDLNTLPTRIAQGEDALGAVRSIDQSMERLEQTFTSEQAAWIRSDSLALRSVYGPFLVHADTSSLLRPEVEQRIEAEGRAAVSELRNRLFSVQTQYGPLLARDDDQLGVQWHPEITELRNAIGNLVDQPYMRSPGSEMNFRATIPSGRRMVWRPAVMEQVVRRVVQEYDSLVTQGLNGYPPSVRAAARSVATAGMRENLMKYVSQAQSFELSTEGTALRETQVRRRIDRFERALTPLNQVLAVQNQLGMNAARNQIVQTTGMHAYRLLQDVDALLQRDGLYSVAPTAFEQWRGERPPNLAFASARDVEGVSAYLDTQRRRMKALATDLAGPLLSFLIRWRDQLDPSYRRLIEKWSNLQTQVRKYENQTAGNTLSVFEDFLKNEIGDVEPVSYYTNTLESTVGEQSSDFFLQRRNEIRRQLYERSRELSIRQARREYQRIAEAFQDQLAGNFPFASLSGEGFIQDASPQSIRAFYSRFDPYAGTYLPVLEEIGASDRVLQFLRKLRGVRPFFAAFLDDPAEYPVPTVEIEPTFHVNRASSRAADQVIDWQLRVGRNVARQIGTADSLNWAAGERVGMRLRWAKDAPERLLASEQGTVDAEAQAVSYRYTGKWALLRLLRRHAGQPADFDRRFDPDPQTLRFTAQIEDKQSGRTRRALVFLRLRLFRPGQGDRIVLEESFPVRAPEMQEVSAMGQSSPVENATNP